MSPDPKDTDPVSALMKEHEAVAKALLLVATPVVAVFAFALTRDKPCLVGTYVANLGPLGLPDLKEWLVLGSVAIAVFFSLLVVRMARGRNITIREAPSLQFLLIGFWIICLAGVIGAVSACSCAKDTWFKTMTFGVGIDILCLVDNPPAS